MRIALILPFRAIAESSDLWLRRYRKMAYAPTTLTTLAALVPQDLDASVQLLDEGVDEVDVASVEADLVGISVMTPNAPRAYRMADDLRRRGITVVLGGVHVTLVPEEAALHADAIVIGYAEPVWAQLLTDFRDKCLKRVYQGESDNLFDQMPKQIRYDLLRANRYVLPNSIESTRGCTNRCRFCVVPVTSRKKYCVRPVEDVVTEMRQRGGNDWVFLDASPADDPSYTQKLYAALRPLKIRWYSSITFRQLLDPGWVEQAVESGCRGVLIGFESLNEQSLRSVGKGFNKIEAYRRAIKKLHNNGVFILGCFIFGFDYDDESVFKKTVDFVNETNIDLVHYGIATPFPGTNYYRQLEAEDRILTRDWSLYDCTRVVFQPMNMSVTDLQNGYLWAYRETHKYSSILSRVLRSGCNITHGLIGNISFRLMGRIIEREVMLSGAHECAYPLVDLGSSDD